MTQRDLHGQPADNESEDSTEIEVLGNLSKPAERAEGTEFDLVML